MQNILNTKFYFFFLWFWFIYKLDSLKKYLYKENVQIFFKKTFDSHWNWFHFSF